MINILPNSNGRTKYLIAAFLMFYQILFFSFIHINKISIALNLFPRHSQNIFPVSNPNYSKLLVISKNDSQKVYGGSRFPNGYFNDLTKFETDFNSRVIAYAVLKNKHIRFNTSCETTGADLRSPPFKLS